VVPEPVLQRLTERLVRGSDEVSGSGLGLAIAKTIASGRPDGFEAIVQFLLAPTRQTE
jgi:two-component system OmpR family sensor kinase